MIIGNVKEIIRYPVKSFHGEKINKVKVLGHGLYGDRSHGFMTEEGRYLTQTQLPEMTTFKARFKGDEQPEAYPSVEVISAEGKVFAFEDTALLDWLERLYKKRLTRIKHHPAYTPFGAIEVENILLVTDSSIKYISHVLNKEVNHLRFRPNIVIDLYNKKPFSEQTWVGKRLKIGDVEVVIKKGCKRCSIINIDPSSGIIDRTVLKTVFKENQNIFGVYAAVLKEGSVKTGDMIILLDG
jgi:uncharacterized protein YcbX